MTQYHVYHTLQINYQSLSLKQRARSVNWRCFRRRRAPWPRSSVPWSLNSANQNIQVSSYLDGSISFIVSISIKQLFVCLLVPRSCKRSDTLFQKSLLLFSTLNMERVLLQPANSLLQPAKKVRIYTKFRSFYKTLHRCNNIDNIFLLNKN